VKHLVAGEALGFNFDKPQLIELGETYGHLEVLEELEKPRVRGRRWRCRCLKCGAETIKKTGDLTKATKFRACKACTEVYMQEVRTRWNRGGSY
jgi:hypothetical protein